MAKGWLIDMDKKGAQLCSTALGYALFSGSAASSIVAVSDMPSLD